MNNVKSLYILFFYIERFIIYIYKEEVFYIPNPEQVLPTLIYMCVVCVIKTMGLNEETQCVY